LDVLDELDAIRIAVGYRVDGEPMDSLPIGAEAVADCQPIYEEMPGWRASTLGLRSLDELPGAARDYLRRIEEIVGVPVDMISTGPDRNHTIVLRNPLD
jgi:adenylosuccinate synthase